MSVFLQNLTNGLRHFVNTYRLEDKSNVPSVFDIFYQQVICTSTTASDRNLCEENELMYRFILARNVGPFKVFNLLLQAMEGQMHKLSKAFSWYLLRSIMKNSSISDFLGEMKDIWPGFFCRCSKHKKGHSAICSKEPVIVVDADEYLEGLPEEMCGIPVIQSAYYLTTENPDDKSETFFEDNYNSTNMPTLSGENAQELFMRHTKLTLLYISITQPWCVRLCCQAKGIIPMGEQHLPVAVCSMKTKVLHGNISFLQKMHVGNKIGPSTKTSWGTLGGFVQRNGRDAFVRTLFMTESCFYVEANEKKNEEEVEVKCYFNGEANVFICGCVIDDKFKYDAPKKTSVDAAVVVLDRSTSLLDKDEIVQIIDSHGNQSHPATFLGMTSAYLNDNYISHKIEKGEMKARLVGAKSGYFERNVKYEDYDADKQTFKDGLEQGVVPQWADLAQQLEKVRERNEKPLHVATDVHFQTTLIPKLDEMTKHDRHFVRFYNQLLMENFSFESGDSGTCIYIVEDKSFTRADNQSNPTGCIGMAIANYIDVRDKDKKIIVTPMKAILDILGLI
ncbi:unnamed protein product [Mytilus coruscus]|uniref:Uncharacterized protein n=1 Tax=Mytilus coruscus TaxID=42192 RepID=A0A6J8A8J5_MYTCO|nr:unnamed protein product [Mytilus coruscus]